MAWFKKLDNPGPTKEVRKEIRDHSMVWLKAKFNALEKARSGLMANYKAIKKYGQESRPDADIINKQLYPLVNLFSDSVYSLVLNIERRNDKEGSLIVQEADSVIHRFVGYMFAIQYDTDWTLSDKRYFEKLSQQDWKGFEIKMARARRYLEVLLSGAVGPESKEIGAGSPRFPKRQQTDVRLMP